MAEYLRPSSEGEAQALLDRSKGQARILAGGTDLIPDLRSGKIAPRSLVDITGIDSVCQIEIQEKQITVGAAVPFAEIRDHAGLKERIPMLAEAAGSVGAGGIQAAATWAGNIVQAMPAADGAIAALALEVQTRILSQAGAVWRPVEDLFQGPGISRLDSTREWITHLRINLPGPEISWGAGWRRIGRRAALILPIVNCAARLELVPGEDEPIIQRAALALGPMGRVPFRARNAETSLLGRPPTPAVFQEAGLIALEEARPRSSQLRASETYRRDVIPVIVNDVLQEALQHTAN